MKKYIIPLENLPNQTLKVELGGKNCRFTFVSRGGRVYLNEMSIEDKNVLCGIVCLNKTNILQYIDFDGKLYFDDLDGNKDPEYTGFNNRFVLVYEDGVDV